MQRHSCRCQRLFARAHAVDEFAVVAGADLELRLARADLLGKQRLGIGIELAAVDPDPSFVADPFRAALDFGVAARDGQRRVIGIDGAYLVAFGGVERIGAWRVFAHAFHRDGTIRVPPHAPVRDVHVVADPIHQLAAAKVQVPPPVHVDAGFAVRHLGRGAQPAVIE